ncbi:MAG: hypothetical protein DRP62_03305 [Planctomycetota bacterium]|nr:MAG: hypothetical protein DRP62_03305 [Planctomycetota bacterium]
MQERTKRILKFLLRLLITTALLWLVLSRIDLQQVGQTIKTARWGFLIIVWVLAVLTLWIRSVKMRFILKRQDCKVGTMKIFGASAVTSLYSLIMPGMLSTGIKWYILKQHTGKGSNVLSAMVYNQAADIVVRVLLGLAAIIIANPGGGRQLPVICGIITAVIVAGCFLLLNRRTGPKGSAALSYALRAFPKIVRSPAETILEQVKVFQIAGYRFHLLIAGVSLSASLLGIALYVCAARAAGINVPVMALVWQSSAVYILGRLPISIANLGVREFTLIEFLALYGIEAPAVLLMSMIIFSTQILMAAIGVGCQITWALSGRRSTRS